MLLLFANLQSSTPVPNTPPLPHGVYSMHSLTASCAEEHVYLGRDNTIELRLCINDNPITHTHIIRCQVQVGASLLDSSISPSLFDLTKTDRLVMAFGQSGLIPGRYKSALIIYDSVREHGVVWSKFMINVSPANLEEI